MRTAITESSMDFPRDTLCPEIWHKAIAPDGVSETWQLTPEAAAAIRQIVSAAVAEASLPQPSATRITGSIASTQWTPECDIDVHLLGLAADSGASDAVSKQLRKAAASLVSSGLRMEIAGHPVELYAQGNPFQDLMSAGCYDVEARRWEVGPDLVDPEFNPWGEYMAGIQKTAGERIAKIRNQIFSTYEIAVAVVANADTEFGRSLHEPFARALAAAADKFTDMRAKRRAFSDPKSAEEALQMRSSREWKLSDAAFKLLGKYGYSPILKKFSGLSQLIDEAGPDVDVEIAEQVLSAVQSSIADADRLSEMEMFGDADGSSLNEGALQMVSLAALLAIPGILPAAKVEQAVKSFPKAEQRVWNSKIQTKLKKATPKKIGKFSEATATNVISWCIYAEANNQGLAGKKAVASVILNRAGGDVQKLMDVVLKPAQFSCFNAGNPWKLKIPKSDADWTIKPPAATARNAEELKSWWDCVAIAAQLAGGTFKSTIGNRNSYLNKDVVKKINPSVLEPSGWGSKMTSQLKIGDHTFGYLRSNDGCRSSSKKCVVVKRGDTLWSIAKANHMTVAQLAAKNKIDPAAPLQVGKKLLV